VRVSVVGLGKIGLPLAVQVATKGHTVTGCDRNANVVRAINAGRSPIGDEPGLEHLLAEAIKTGSLQSTTDTAAGVTDAEVILVIVPVLVDGAKAVDFTALDDAVSSIGKGLMPGALVIVETTVPVGTTRDRVAPMLAKRSSLVPGEEFSLAFSPERVYAGRIFQDLKTYPKVVGGIDAASTERAVKFYQDVLDAQILSVKNAETAEFTKIAETTYRDVNIALANQLALFGRGRNVDVLQGFAAANTQPYSHIHAPSIGVGGHCIPVYPYFLLTQDRDLELTILRSARKTNDGMAARYIGWLDAELDGLAGRRILLLGLTYRQDVHEVAFSSAWQIAAGLANARATVLLHDALLSPEEISAFPGELAGLDQLQVDAVVVNAYHRQYRQIDWAKIKGLKVVVDGRGALDPQVIERLGIRYLSIAG
jgi:nucleotide sugar dehydrogenase